MTLLNKGIDTNENGTQAQAVTILDKDGNQIDETYPLPISGTVTAEGGLTDAELRAAPVPVKGSGFEISIPLTVTNGVYTIGDVVGGLITIPNAVSAAGKRGFIYELTLAGVAAIPYNLFFFPSDIATPAADNAPGTMVAADIAMCKGVIPILAADYLAPVSAFNIATVREYLAYSCPATTLYAYLVAVAVTSPGTTTLTLKLKGEYID